MSPRFDVVVVGAGPAGLIAASACGQRGLRTAIVAPEPDAPWEPTYGVWVDDVVDAELAAAMARTWSEVHVRHLRADVVHGLYGLVDRPAWQSILWGRCERSGVERIAARVDRVEHGRDGSVVHGADVHGGVHVDARVVVWAAGASSGAGLFQVAWGEWRESSVDDVMHWMVYGDAGTFLYAMPLGDRVFVEETALATRTVDLDGVKARLHARVAADGRLGRVLAVERCVIPLDAPLRGPERMVRFGAAGGMVNPSTGYLLARLVRDAPVLADALAGAMERPPDAMGPAAWNALWPRARRLQRRMHALGAALVARLSPSQLKTFFAAFFRLPASTRRAWLADRLGPVELAAAMAQMPFLMEV